MNFKIQDLDDRYKNYKPGTEWPPEKFSCYRKVTEFCNEATLWLFFGATILFVVYAIMVQNYSYEQALQNKGTQEVTMSKEKKIDKADEIVRKEDRSGQFSDQVKGGRKGNVREERAETEATEPVIRPTEKPKK